MNPDPEAATLVLNEFTINMAIGLFVLIILLLFSALVSGTEVALFSLSPAQIDELKSNRTRKTEAILAAISKPRQTLATILISNNFANIAIVLVSTYLLENIFDFANAPEWFVFLIQVVVVTFLLLLFGEIMPKIYANVSSLKFASFFIITLSALDKLFKPFSLLMIRITSVIERYFDKYKNPISVDVLSEALKLADDVNKEDKRILKGIVSFGNIDANGVMTPRVDVVAVPYGMKFNDLIDVVNSNGFSRMPVYEDTFDNIKGILFTKDLIPFLDSDIEFDWQAKLREPYFIPETKKINELLQEFQTKKIHMAIVVDEYGGVNGLVTIEDILEEIVGEMNDEFDDEQVDYEKIDNYTYIFEGKTLLYDIFKLLELDSSHFEDIKGDADTIAGLFLEIKGEFPKKGEKLLVLDLELTAEQLDHRRIKKIRVCKKIT